MNNIDRNKHNKYVVGWTPTIPQQDATSSSTSTSTTTIIVGGGGSGSGTGLTGEQAEKLESIEYGAQVNQNAYSYLSLSDGVTTVIQAARLQRDTANLSIIGKQGIETSLVCELKLPETTITSTGQNTGVYKVSYGKVINKIETPSEDPEGEPTITEEITWPLIITYVSGEQLQTTSFDTIKLINQGVETTLTDYQIETNETGITSITKDQSNLIFDQIKFTLTTTPEATEEVPEPESITTEVLVLNAVVYNYCTYYVSNTGDGYWKLDEDGNLYTDYNAYSTKELSAYGLGEGTGGTGGGAGYLYELGDVDEESASSPIDGGILQYNATTHLWEVTDGSNINPDLKDYAKVQWVNDQIDALIGDAPADLDTLGEIATRLQSLEILLEWFEWDDTNQAIKALFNLYGVGEISAYGYRAGGGETGGKSYLNELEDVDITNLQNQGILQYNATTKMWEVTDGSSIRPDLSSYAETTWVTQQINNAVTNLIDGAPSDLNTLGKIATVIEELQQFLDWFSFVDGRIRANYNLWGVGEISAYGYRDGEGTTGTSFLRELQDVQLSESLKTGDLLMYDASTQMWQNVDKSSVGLNETELRQYLETNNYLQEGDVTWNNLTGKPNTFKTNISLIENLNSGWDTLLTNSPTDYVTRWPAFSEVTDKPTTLEGYGITDAFTKEQTDDRYVNITGDTMTGDLTLPNAIVTDTLVIGSIILEYDSITSALKIYRSGSSIANVYATGEISAYGLGQSGSSGLDEDLLWDILGGNTTEQINISHLTEALSSYLKISDTESDGTQVIATDIRLKNDTAYGSTLYFGDREFAYISEKTDDDLTIHATDLNLEVSRLLLNGEEIEFGGGGIGEVVTSGSGNIVSTITANDTTLTVTKTYTINSGTTNRLAYYSASTTIDDYSSTEGSSTNPIYLSNGVPTACSYNINANVNSGLTGYLAYYSSNNTISRYTNTIGSSSTPIYISNGLPSVCAYSLSASINSGVSGRLAYYSSASAIDDYGSTIGSSTRLWYLNAGVPTNSSSTIGSNENPIFLSNGSITASSKYFLVDIGAMRDTSTGTNWNNLLRPGMYFLATEGGLGSETGSPGSSYYGYGNLIVFGSGSSAYGGARTQLYFEHGNSAAYRTTYSASSSRWRAWNKILTDRNIGSYALTPSNYSNTLNSVYVNVSGDTMTGALVLNSTLRVGGTSTFNSQTTHNYGILTSTLTANQNITAKGAIILDYYGGTWLSMCTRTDDGIYSNNKASSGSAHMMMRMRNYNGDYVVFGGLNNETGVYYFTNSNVTSGVNNYSARTIWTPEGMSVHGTRIYTNGYMRIGDGAIRWDSSTNSLYVEKYDGSRANLYATGEVSAYGKGTGTPTAQVVSIMDVRDNTIYPNTYDSGMRIFFKKNGTAVLTSSQLGGEFHTLIQINKWHDSSGGRVHQMAFGDNNTIWTRVSNSACTGWESWKQLGGGSDGDYLPLAGGTMSGTLTLSHSSFGQGLIIKRSDSNNTPAITYSNNSATFGRIGVGSASSSYPNEPLFYPGTSRTPEKIWTSGNDGSSSGLDADLLDGTHKSGLFTSMTYSSSQLSLTIGGVTKSVPISFDLGDLTFTQLTINGSIVVKDNADITGWCDADEGFNVTKAGDLQHTSYSYKCLGYPVVRYNGTDATIVSGGKTNDVLYLRAGSTNGGGAEFKLVYNEGIYCNTNLNVYKKFILSYNQSPVLETRTWRAGINWDINGYTLFELGSSGGDGGVPFLSVGSANVTGQVDLGMSTRRFRTIYSVNSLNTSSDIRLKDVLNYTNLNLKDISNAPVFSYKWKTEEKDSGIHIGGSAQYWQNVLPEVVIEGKDGYLSMEYDRIAYAAVISLAKETESIEERVTKLESENAELKAKIERYEKLNRQRIIRTDILDVTIDS